MSILSTGKTYSLQFRALLCLLTWPGSRLSAHEDACQPACRRLSLISTLLREYSASGIRAVVVAFDVSHLHNQQLQPGILLKLG